MGQRTAAKRADHAGVGIDPRGDTPSKLSGGVLESARDDRPAFSSLIGLPRNLGARLARSGRVGSERMPGSRTSSNQSAAGVTDSPRRRSSRRLHRQQLQAERNRSRRARCWPPSSDAMQGALAHRQAGAGMGAGWAAPCGGLGRWARRQGRVRRVAPALPRELLSGPPGTLVRCAAPRPAGRVWCSGRAGANPVSTRPLRSSALRAAPWPADESWGVDWSD